MKCMNILVVSLMVLLTFGCSSDDDDDMEDLASAPAPAPVTVTPAPSPATVTVSGQWRGNLASSRGSGSLSAMFSQSGNDVTGTVVITIATAPNCGGGSVQGTVSGTTLRGTITTPDGGRVTFEGTVGNTIVGTYSVSGGFCNGDQGNFSLSRA